MISLVNKMLLIVAVLSLSACATGQSKPDDASGNSVKVTNMERNHGGTGIILKSTFNGSLVLTNSHVCGVVEDGGMVSGKAGNFMVTAYKKSETHDLCLIKVSGDLRGGVKVANRPPVPYYEAATISGHPALYPNVKTYGHFSGRESIAILTGFKKCTDEDMEDPEKAYVCMMIGGLPIIKNYDSVLVTATIMPGSSGSAVYNSDMELSGVAFAGSGSLGYAWTVPYEYVKYFLNKEARTLDYEKPTNVIDIFAVKGKKSGERQMLQNLREACDSPEKVNIKNLCEIVQSDLTM